jgi:hypothetical protein
VKPNCLYCNVETLTLHFISVSDGVEIKRDLACDTCLRSKNPDFNKKLTKEELDGMTFSNVPPTWNREFTFGGSSD